jgi:hypothetical protein
MPWEKAGLQNGKSDFFRLIAANILALSQRLLQIFAVREASPRNPC